MRQMGMLKEYKFKAFVDLASGKRGYIDGCTTQSSLKECLQFILNETANSLDEIGCKMDFDIGIFEISTDDHTYDHRNSYMNKIIYEDEVLREWYYC